MGWLLLEFVEEVQNDGRVKRVVVPTVGTPAPRLSGKPLKLLPETKASPFQNHHSRGCQRAKQSIVIAPVELDDLGHHVVEVRGGRDAILRRTEPASIRDCREVVEVPLLRCQSIVVVSHSSARRTKRRPSASVVGVSDGVPVLEGGASQVVRKPTLVTNFGEAVHRPVVVVSRLTSTRSCTRRINRLGKDSPPSNEETH